MSKIIQGIRGGVYIEKFAVGTNISDMGTGYRVVARKRTGVEISLDFSDIEDAYNFYHLIYKSMEVL